MDAVVNNKHGKVSDYSERTLCEIDSILVKY